MPKPSGTLTLKRVGSFDVNVTGKNHCGTKNPLNIQYHVEVTCSPVLDQRGFLFDQINVQHFFDSVTSTKDSCENLSIILSRELWKRIQTENPDCEILEMSMTLSASPYKASMTFNFRKDTEKEPPKVLQVEEELDQLRDRVESLTEERDGFEEDLDDCKEELKDRETTVGELRGQLREKDRRLSSAQALLSHWLRGGLRGSALEALKEDTRKWLPAEPKSTNKRKPKT